MNIEPIVLLANTESSLCKWHKNLNLPIYWDSNFRLLDSKAMMIESLRANSNPFSDSR